MVLKEMVRIIIFYKPDNKDKALELFSKFENSLNINSYKCMKKDIFILQNECFRIETRPLTAYSYRGLKFNLAYVPNDINEETENFLGFGAIGTRIIKY